MDVVPSSERAGVCIPDPPSPNAGANDTPVIPLASHPSPSPQLHALKEANTSLPSSTSTPLNPADDMVVNDRNVRVPASALSIIEIPEDGVSVELNGDINMHPDNESGPVTSPDLQREFQELRDLSEKRLMEDPLGVFRERKSILDGYEATAASHRSEIRRLEELFNDWGMDKGIPGTIDKLLLSTTLEDANRSMSEARDGLEQAERAYKEFLSSTLVDCRSSALRDVLQLTRDRMTTKGVGVIEAGRWKGIFHLAEDELREINEQALVSFRLGVPDVEPPPKKNKDSQKGKRGKREKKEKADDDDRKATDSVALRQRWLEMSEEEQEKLQGMLSTHVGYSKLRRDHLIM